MEDAKSSAGALLEAQGRTQGAGAAAMQDREAPDYLEHLRNKFYAERTQITQQLKCIKNQFNLLEEQENTEHSFIEFIREVLQVYDIKKAEIEKLLAKVKEKLAELKTHSPYDISALYKIEVPKRTQLVPVTSNEIISVITFMENELELMLKPDIVAYHDKIRKVLIFYDKRKSEKAILQAELIKKVGELKVKYAKNSLHLKN